jgi:hypothetical protein
MGVQVKAAGGLAKWNPSYGDWVPADSSLKVDGAVCSSYNYIVNAAQMAELARALGASSDAQKYSALHDSLVNEFNAAFYKSAGQVAGLMAGGCPGM